MPVGESRCLYSKKIVNANYQYLDATHNLDAPREVVPLVMDMVTPESVLDVGCGTGTWLQVFGENGVSDYLGIDADHVPAEKLRISPERFIVRDLGTRWQLDRKFDLVVCLEVAEHVPPAAADNLVSSVVSHGDVILFSAAIPGQGGQFHVNEQWPEYWQKKFAVHGFYFHDVLRSGIWDNPRVNWWYRQNIFLITREYSGEKILPLVHPECYMANLNILKNAIESVASGREGVISSAKIFLRSLQKKFASHQ